MCVAFCMRSLEPFGTRDSVSSMVSGKLTFWCRNFWQQNWLVRLWKMQRVCFALSSKNSMWGKTPHKQTFDLFLLWTFNYWFKTRGFWVLLRNKFLCFRIKTTYCCPVSFVKDSFINLDQNLWKVIKISGQVESTVQVKITQKWI